MEKVQQVVLPELTIPLNTQLGFRNNGDKLREDERVFDYWQSVHVVEVLKHRTSQDFIALGLELYWVKLHLKHGDFLGFLQDVGISRSTGSRFMKAVREYLGTYVLKGNAGKRQIREAMSQIYSEVALTQHLDRGEFWGNKRKNGCQVTLDTVEAAVFEHCGGVFRVFADIRRLKDKTFYRGAFIRFLKEVVKQAQLLLEELEENHTLSLFDFELLEDEPTSEPTELISRNAENESCSSTLA